MSHIETAREDQMVHKLFKFESSKSFNFIHVSNLSTVAIEETEPYVHKSKAAGLKQKVAQEEGYTPVGPAAMDQ